MYDIPIVRTVICSYHLASCPADFNLASVILLSSTIPKHLNRCKKRRIAMLLSVFATVGFYLLKQLWFWLQGPDWRGFTKIKCQTTREAISALQNIMMLRTQVMVQPNNVNHPASIYVSVEVTRIEGRFWVFLLSTYLQLSKIIRTIKSLNLLFEKITYFLV